ncbi:beta/gamma crystallin-related protein [Candidatus Riflebacteria bacterium]
MKKICLFYFILFLSITSLAGRNKRPEKKRVDVETAIKMAQSLWVIFPELKKIVADSKADEKFIAEFKKMAQLYKDLVPPTHVRFYENNGFSGNYFSMKIGEKIRDLKNQKGWNDKISSFKIYGDLEVVMYRGPNFTGDKVMFEISGDLSKATLNNEVSSIEVRPPNKRLNTATFFEHPNYQGKFFRMKSGESMRKLPQGWDDKISSVKIIGKKIKVIGYERINFLGQGLVLPKEGSPHLHNIKKGTKNWDDKISSIRVIRTE